MHSDSKSRVDTIDIMRGITLFLMLFVNDLFEPGVPHWLVHAGTYENSIGLADLVFPAFLFIVGLSVPLAIEARKWKPGNHNLSHLLYHIILRTASLLIIGVLILNGSERLNADLTRIPKYIWLLLLYLGVFLVWNNYKGFLVRHGSGSKQLTILLKIIGILLLGYLVWKFKAGDELNASWIKHGWWGILGLIGWGYFAAALTYIIAGPSVKWSLVICFFFLFLNIASLSGWLGQSDWGGLRDLLSVWISGNVPFITTAGLVVGLLLQQTPNKGRLIKLLLLSGGVCVLLGFELRQWFIFSKNIGTPSWAMVCIGVSLLLLALLYYIVEIKEYKRWALIFQLAGRNALTTYLAPDMIYFIVWYLGGQLFFYKQAGTLWLAIGGSTAWALIMILYGSLLSKVSIRLKL